MKKSIFITCVIFLFIKANLFSQQIKSIVLDLDKMSNGNYLFKEFSENEKIKFSLEDPTKILVIKLGRETVINNIVTVSKDKKDYIVIIDNKNNGEFSVQAKSEPKPVPEPVPEPEPEFEPKAQNPIGIAIQISKLKDECEIQKELKKYDILDKFDKYKGLTCAKGGKLGTIIPSSLLSGTGLDPTIFFNGLADWGIKRMKEEANIAFLNKFREDLKIEPFISILPNVSEGLTNTDNIFNFPNYMKTLRENAYEDMNNFPRNMSNFIQSNVVTILDADAKIGILSSIELIEGIRHKMPASLQIENLAGQTFITKDKENKISKSLLFLGSLSLSPFLFDFVTTTSSSFSSTPSKT